MHTLNHTHDVHARSWVESANPTATDSSDFPVSYTHLTLPTKA